MPNTESHRNSLIALIKEILSVFYFNRRKQFYFLLGIIFFSSIADVVSFTLIIPVIYLINDPQPIREIEILRLVYTELNFNSTGHFIFFLLLGLVFVFLIKNIFLLFSVYIQNKFVYAVAKDILKKKLSDFYKNDYLDVKENNSIEYLRCLLEAPQGFADSLMMPMIFILNESLVVIFILIALLFYKVAVILLLVITIVPIGYFMVYIAKRKLQENSEKRTILEKEAYVTAVEGINAYRDVKLFGKEDSFINSILSVFSRYYKVLILRNIYILTPRRIIEILVVGTICILFIIANFGLHASKNQLVLILLTFSTAAYRLLPSLNEIVTNIVRVKTSVYILDLLKFIKEPDGSDDKFDLLSFDHKIEMADINFTYKENNKMVLKDVSLSIQKGAFVILTGDSGSGKTTIGKILTGFIRSDTGKYIMDDVEVKHINQIKWHIGYVTQDFYLFDKTLLENIAIGDNVESVDLKKIDRILKYTNLKQFVDSLPLGIYQPIGEMGAKLSGGQKQRIAIARALYREIDFLVLDEATSSLDKVNEQEVIDTIYNISKETNLTVLLITHSVSFVKRFDAIYEIRDGHLNKLN